MHTDSPFGNPHGGRTRFLRWMFVRKDGGIFFTGLVLILVPSTLFAVMVLPRLWDLSPAISFVFAWVLAVTLASMVKTSLTDPGFLPRNAEPLKQDSERTPIGSSPRPQNPSVSNANPPPVTGALPTSYPFVPAQGSSTRIPQNLENRTIYVRNTPITLKFCITCQLWRTPRTSHCSTCDRCVENHDHHCPWIANCVGKRNYRYFYTFICACSILSIYIFAFSLIGLLRISRATNQGFGHAITQRPVNFALMLYSVLIGWSVVGMTCYHCWITCEGITTHEQLKQRFNSEQIRRVNALRRGDDTHGTIGPQSAYPFSRGSGISNMCWILCRHQPPR
ncbi:DHHC palmitoyltransferase-domain-containing protein [Gaertneriomyces semiglobifer]|nr:DHHC palmitoyltransferase-domain-containing protein [Gaertneriomyces semiglobifer]